MSQAGSIDPAEVAKFSALARSWWDPHGPFAALHRMNPVRLGFIREAAAEHFGRSGPRPLLGLKAVDVGCGGGLAALPLARLGADVIGLDASGDAVAAARLRATEAGVGARFEQGDVERFAAAHPESADLVTALEVVEHVADIGAFFEGVARLLKPNGLIIVSTINRTQKARTLALFAAERVLRMAPEGAHEFEKLVTPKEIELACPAFEWAAPRGLSFHPLGRTWALSDDFSMNYLRAGVKRRGTAQHG